MDLPYDDEGELRRAVAGARDLAFWRFDTERMRARAEAWSIESYWREWPLLRAKQTLPEPREWTKEELNEALAARAARYESFMARLC